MQRRDDRHLAIPGWLWMVCCALLFSVAGILIKILVVGHGANVFWIGWVRFGLGLLLMTLPGLAGMWSLRVYNRGLFVARGVVGSSGVFLMYVAIAYIGLGRSMVLAYLMGLFGALSGVFILRERPSRLVLGAVVLTTTGVLLSCRARLPWGAEWAALGTAVLSGITLSLVRRLRRTDSVPVVLLSQSLFGTLLLAVPALLSPMPRGAVVWALMLCVGGADVAGQLCMTQGLSRLPVARGAALMMLTPVFSLLAGTALLGEVLVPVQWLGCAMVLAASLLAMVRRPGSP